MHVPSSANIRALLLLSLSLSHSLRSSLGHTFLLVGPPAFPTSTMCALRTVSFGASSARPFGVVRVRARLRSRPCVNGLINLLILRDADRAICVLAGGVSKQLGPVVHTADSFDPWPFVRFLQRTLLVLSTVCRGFVNGGARRFCFGASVMSGTQDETTENL